MKKLLSIILSLCLLLSFAAAEEAPAAKEAAKMSAEELCGAGKEAYDAGKFEKAVEYWQLAADQGSAKAQFNMGVLYEFGEGVEQSFEKALEYYRLAADQGFALAQYNLGLMYAGGKGVEQSDEKTAEYFLLAADQGLAEAQFNIGLMYYHGRGVEQSYE